jgi:hypothetical protein
MWATLIVSIAKAVPAAKKIYLQSVDLFFAYEQSSDDRETNEISEERDGIVAALQQPGMSDANRRALRRRLIALSRL